MIKRDKVGRVRRSRTTKGRMIKTISVDKMLVCQLEALGFHVPSLVEELMKNVAGKKECPTCGRLLKQRITRRGDNYSNDDDCDFLN